MYKVLGKELPQALPAVTETLPAVKPAGKETVIELEPCPALIKAPLGTDQVKKVAPVVEAGQLKVCSEPTQMPVFKPVMAVGVEGMERTLMARTEL
jgi:hypothetical protein